jgi:CubicO group peptidase (beta-lactamase class C family)
MNPDMSFSLSPVGEFGWDGAAGSFAMVDPINKIAVFFATHVYEAQFLYHVVHPMMRNLVYEALEN